MLVVNFMDECRCSDDSGPRARLGFALEAAEHLRVLAGEAESESKQSSQL